MSPAQVLQIYKQYGYVPQVLKPVQKGYRNESYAGIMQDGTTLNVIIYKREPGMLTRIKNAHYVGNYLSHSDYTVRAPADNRIVHITASESSRYAAIYAYLPGLTIPWEAYTMEHLKQLGACLSNLHADLTVLPQANLPLITDELFEITRHMHTYFADSNVQQALFKKLNVVVNVRFKSYDTLLQLLATRSKQQPLHMDFVRGNILFAANQVQITGVIDFEKVAWGLPLFDIARTLAFLLVDCKYKTERQIRKYFLGSGYNKRGASSVCNTRVLEELITFFLLYDFYKFLQHNPYESLQVNEHYVRTKDLLRARRTIST